MTSNNSIPKGYLGREQALIKHDVLKEYLKKLTAILGVSSNNNFEFTYVDCFAGPWGDTTEAMSTTSIAISLEVLSSCKAMLKKNGSIVNMRALYVEQDNTRFGKLDKYLSKNTPQGISTHCIHGEFVASRNEILSWTGEKGFAFFFIDPKGWMEIKVENLRPLLERPRSEFVINFMYDFINRTVPMLAHQQNIKELLGEKIDLDDVSIERELQILNTYRNNLKKLVPQQNSKYPVRSSYVKILDPKKDRTKYHLIYLTSHPKGIIKFMETCEKSSWLQDVVRAQIRDNRKNEKTGNGDLFADDAPFIDDSENRNNEPNIDQYWLNYIKNTRTIQESDFADILESTNWFPKELQASLGRLISSNKVINLDAKQPRRTRHLHFEEHGGERLKII